MTDKDKQTLKNSLSNKNLEYRYKGAVKFFSKDTGKIDEMEYRTFQDFNIKKDMVGLAHAYLNMVFTWDEYWNKVIYLVGVGLLVQNLIKESNKVKQNGEDK